ncbi:aminotransferase class I/II-fold pyridoxal phosphate-dependent enzyme [Telmatospirillum sp.]|uniref:aminotransferase class I/II-fold pyridoxal phosphate-dependent enzyme n=1 Tax=Telmatospirillum sp. TaxID=2079197 RepID=UPI0028476427|nr:aminotransferase class I/II-fold pyridoxal phosphate-dependent enzyme [Telmatospirillum sp.]MDR3439577.1 aminotransferase class I/II-fold pyridoxal phosphate-dependent enzyme [Telmatospirillum sp.]
MTNSRLPFMINPRLDLLTDYPFQRLTALLQDPPGAEPINLSIGEPQHQPPAMVTRILAEQAAGWGKYPPTIGTPPFRTAVGAWLTNRFHLPAGAFDADKQILPLAGSREGLFQVIQIVCRAAPDQPPPLVLMPNPFYQVYAGATYLAGAEPVFVPASRESGFLPDFSALPESILQRAALAYLCSPANPQGAVAGLSSLRRTIALARRYGFVLAADECYSEIYDQIAPVGALEACGGDFANVLVFHSLSKRSSVPGLRSGFVAGDARLIDAFRRFRAYSGTAMPLPVVAASTALWQDETHVVENRALYRAKMDAAAAIFGDRLGFYRPGGGFYLWLDVGDGEKAALRLWREAGVRVLPGAYLGRPGPDGVNPGAAFVRIALVQDLATTERALERIANTLVTA